MAKRDEGWYRCGLFTSTDDDSEAEEADPTWSDWARVTVEARVRIVQYPDIVRKKYGSPMDLQCSATGDPPPLITWLKGGMPVSSRELKLIIPHLGGSDDVANNTVVFNRML